MKINSFKKVQTTIFVVLGKSISQASKMLVYMMSLFILFVGCKSETATPDEVDSFDGQWDIMSVTEQYADTDHSEAWNNAYLTIEALEDTSYVFTGFNVNATDSIYLGLWSGSTRWKKGLATFEEDEGKTRLCYYSDTSMLDYAYCTADSRLLIELHSPDSMTIYRHILTNLNLSLDYYFFRFHVKRRATNVNQ